MDILKNLGFDPEKLTQEDIEALEEIGKKIKVSPNSDPNRLLKQIRDLGVDIDGMIKRMRAKEQKVSNRIGRNELCPCKSNKKYKKCCGK
jgi:hypothetical protein